MNGAVLVTGGTGFIGRETVQVLRRHERPAGKGIGAQPGPGSGSAPVCGLYTSGQCWSGHRLVGRVG